MKKLYLVLLAVLLGISFTYAQDDLDMVVKFNEMNKDYAKLMISGDNEAMHAWYADDIISLPSYQPMLRGLDALKKSEEMQKASGVKFIAFTLETTDVITAGDYYLEIGKYNITMKIPGMDMPWDDNGKYLNVWQKQEDGSLKLKVDTWNTDVNPWMQMQEVNKDKPKDEGKPEKQKTNEGEGVN